MDGAPAASDDPAPRYVPSRLRRAILALATLTTFVGVVGSALLPYLALEHPLWLLVTASDGRNLVLAAPRIGLVPLLAVAVPRRALGMLATYGIGLLYGPAALAWSAKRAPRVAWFVAQLERVFSRYPRLSLVLWPTYTTSALAGARRAPLREYLPWMLVGQVGYVAVCARVGDALGAWTERVTSWLAPRLVEATAASIAIVACYQVISIARRRRAARAAG